MKKHTATAEEVSSTGCSKYWVANDQHDRSCQWAIGLAAQVGIPRASKPDVTSKAAQPAPFGQYEGLS